MNKLEDIVVWQKSMDLVEYIYNVDSNFPESEKFGLSSQIKRCSVSIPSNIAEDAGRNSKKEFAHFLSIAAGSSYELFTQIAIASRVGIIKKNIFEQISQQIIEIQKMIYGFQKSLHS